MPAQSMIDCDGRLSLSFTFLTLVITLVVIVTNCYMYMFTKTFLNLVLLIVLLIFGTVCQIQVLTLILLPVLKKSCVVLTSANFYWDGCKWTTPCRLFCLCWLFLNGIYYNELFCLAAADCSNPPFIGLYKCCEIFC